MIPTGSPYCSIASSTCTHGLADELTTPAVHGGSRRWWEFEEASILRRFHPTTTFEMGCIVSSDFEDILWRALHSRPSLSARGHADLPIAEDMSGFLARNMDET